MSDEERMALIAVFRVARKIVGLLHYTELASAIDRAVKVFEKRRGDGK